ncbi:hypothetical protein [Amycolatopsis sp. YIM 10]|uniref:hypothetical protein n=1 Tax=Amycolatopsis sp. YIM 10 TaxID=2653857 RepID=UPI00128FE890|nr:hypothetical protein [Amycolatopsis sp. YIM 10]QFU85712.1 hypothetical protein YIM_02430 [Amycolatopsis sp. YIM 10]
MGDDKLYDGDGTQPPPPPSAFADPMTGLAGAVRDDVYQMEIAKPIEPDADAVQEMVRAAMANEPELFGPRTSPEASTPEPESEVPAASGTEEPKPGAAPAPTGLIPQQRTWPARPQQLLRQRLRGARQSAKARVPKSVVPKTPASRGSAGVAIAVVLLILFVVIAIQLVSSLVSGIAGIFS